MSLIEYKSIAALLIFATSIIAAIYPLRLKAHPTHHTFLELADSAASGVFLGAALFHMLPDAIQLFQQAVTSYQYPLAESFCAAGFLILLFMERLSSNDTHAHNGAPLMITLILIIHSLIEGAALGININIAAAAIIFLAIIAHKSSESFALAVILNTSSIAFRRAVVVVLIFSFMTPIGIMLGNSTTLLLNEHTMKLMTAGFDAFAAGTFLYMSTLHHINHHHRSHEQEGLLEFVALLAGLLLMAGLAWWA